MNMPGEIIAAATRQELRLSEAVRAILYAESCRVTNRGPAADYANGEIVADLRGKLEKITFSAGKRDEIEAIIASVSSDPDGRTVISHLDAGGAGRAFVFFDRAAARIHGFWTFPGAVEDGRQ
jgi:hypothetical protein